MYKKTSKSEQYRAGKIPLSVTLQEEEILTPQQMRQCIADRIVQLQEEIDLIPKNAQNFEKRRELGKEKFALQEKISKMRKEGRLEPTPGKDMGSFFIDVSKEMLPTNQFKTMWEIARNRYTKAEIINIKPTPNGAA